MGRKRKNYVPGPVDRSMKPTDEQREQVETMATYGLPIKMIGDILKISEPTVQKYFQDEIDRGRASGCYKVANKIFMQALEGDTTLLIFWAKTQMHWREVDRVEHTGKDGGPIEIAPCIDAPREETYEQWLERQEKGEAIACLEVTTGAAVNGSNGHVG